MRACAFELRGGRGKGYTMGLKEGIATERTNELKEAE